MWLEHVESHGDLESLICLGWDLSVLREPQWLDGLYISNIFHREDHLSCAGNFRLPGEIEGFQGGRHLVVVWVGMCPLFCCSPRVLGRVSKLWPIAKAAEFRASYVWRIQFLKVITPKHGWHWPPNCIKLRGWMLKRTTHIWLWTGTRHATGHRSTGQRSPWTQHWRRGTSFGGNLGIWWSLVGAWNGIPPNEPCKFRKSSNFGVPYGAIFSNHPIFWRFRSSSLGMCAFPTGSRAD